MTQDTLDVRERIEAAQRALGFPVPKQEASWTRTYARRLLATDLLVIIVTVFGSHLLWFGLESARLQQDGGGPAGVSYWFISSFLVVGWLIVLEAYDTRDPRVVGIGAMEYKRIFDAGLLLFGVAAILALLFRADPARGYVITAFPLGVALLVLGRWSWRQYLVRKRLHGELMSRTLLVGSVDSVTYLAEQLQRFPAAGYLPVAVCVPNHLDLRVPETVAGLQVEGELDQTGLVAKRLDVDTVMLTSSDYLPPQKVRSIAWSLEQSGIDLALAPAMTEIAGPRIHTRPVVGLPVLHVEVPRYEGVKRLTKAVFDWTVAAVGVVLISPVLFVLAVIVLIDSGRPVFFRQPRVGLNGRVFRMFKFRTMVRDAEAQREALLELNEGSGPLFKLKNDPRVTRSGKWMRRFSLDELPQLFNVLTGDMSIVGPRPPLVEEAERYEPDVRRRLLVKPGITGPWQISGRSDLSWEEGVRLDLYYVENWSIAQDLILIARTASAVLRNRGAY